MTDGLDMLEEWLERITPFENTNESVSHRDFADEVRERMEQGRRSYGDKSFSLPFSMLMDEAKQEAVDLAGWPYMAWRQLRAWEDQLPDGHELLPKLERALDAIELIGWQASVTWSRMSRLVDEVEAMQKANNDNEQDGS